MKLRKSLVQTRNNKFNTFEKPEMKHKLKKITLVYKAQNTGGGSNKEVVKIFESYLVE